MIVLQHNCNSTAATTTAALEAAVERKAELVLLQEPYAGKKHTISHPSYQLRWPECAKKDIRVALAIRIDVLDTYVFEERTDLIEHPCVQCLDVWETRERQKVRRTRIINIYNRARVEGGGYAINRIDLGQLIQGRTILAGDFNARSPLWDPWVEGRHNAGVTEGLIDKHALVVNNDDQPTRCGRKSKSIIDLTLSTPGVGTLRTWEIDEDLATPSDHAVIVFAWEPLRLQAGSREMRPTAGWDIDKLRTDEGRLKRARDHWKELSSSRQQISIEPRYEDLEDEAQWIQCSLAAVLDRHAAPKPLQPRSKRWWTDEIKQERKRFSTSKRALRLGEISFEEYRRIRNRYYCCIRRTKRESWEQFLEGMLPTDEEAQSTTDSERCWRALRYSKPQTPSYTPAIKTFNGNGEVVGVAASAEEKEDVFMKQAFPRQETTDEEIVIPNTTARVGAREVREALFAQSIKKAPGIDKLGFRALRLLWLWDEDRVVALVRGCITSGYHPRVWKTAKGILLRKQGKPTYAVAKAYRAISLLSCLGKVVEKVAATLIASYCETEGVFHQGQFGCRHGRSTSDAVAKLISFVEDAWERKQMVLTLLLDIKGAFDRVNKQQLLKRMIEVGIAGNIIRWVGSFLSDRQAMLVIDGRTGKTHDIQAGLPQGSPVSPVLFILSISAMFPYLTESHPDVESISFVDDIGLALKCSDLGEGVRGIESIARHAVEWGDDHQVEFEIGKTEILVFSKRRKVLQASREATVHLGDQDFHIRHGATKWLGFWLDPKLSFKTHFAKRLASAKGALQRIKGLSGSQGGLSMRLMRRVAVAAVNSVALYGAEVWWRGQQDRAKCLQLLLNSQARAITGLLPSTPIPTLLAAACLPRAEELLDYRQRRFAVRALAAPQDHPTHQLLPANFRMGQLYRHEGARDRLSSVGWISPDKTHRTLGGRLAQQVAKVVTYDTEYGFGLSERVTASQTNLEVESNDPDPTPERTTQEQTEVLTLFAASADARAQNRSLGVGVAWRGQDRWKVKGTSLGRYLTTIDADLFAISSAVKEASSIVLHHGARHVEILSASPGALATISRSTAWAPPLVGDIRARSEQLRNQGCTLNMIQTPGDKEAEAMGAACNTAMQAARRQPRQLRSASLSYVHQSVRETKPALAKMNKYLGDSKKSTTARYLQLKSGHAVTGIHLFRMKKAQDARCWWCNGSSQSVTHLMFECRKWRRERESMLRAISSEKAKTNISARMNKEDLGILFGDASIEIVLRFIERTAVGKRREADGAQRADEWDIGLLDRENDGDWGG